MTFVISSLQALMLLSDMAVIRLDNKPNNVEEVLFSCLLEGVGNSTNALASSTWEGVLYILLSIEFCFLSLFLCTVPYLSNWVFILFIYFYFLPRH